MTGEEKLWRAVLLQAFQDMITHTNNTKLLKKKQAATWWLLHLSKDLSIVCDFAGIHHDTVMNRARTIREANALQWRAEPLTNKRHAIDRRYKLKKRAIAQNPGMTIKWLPDLSAPLYHGEVSP